MSLCVGMSVPRLKHIILKSSLTSSFRPPVSHKQGDVYHNLWQARLWRLLGVGAAWRRYRRDPQGMNGGWFPHWTSINPINFCAEQQVHTRVLIHNHSMQFGRCPVVISHSCGKLDHLISMTFIFEYGPCMDASLLENVIVHSIHPFCSLKSPEICPCTGPSHSLSWAASKWC